jgi:hypothetical protein
MSDDVNKPLNTTEQSKEQPVVPAESRAADVPGPRKSQAVLVYAGIACLVVGAIAGYQSSKRKKEFSAVVRVMSDSRNRQGGVLTEWANQLRSRGGPCCKAIADLITTEQVPDLLKEKGVSSFDEMLEAVGEGGVLAQTCEKELTSQLDMLAWALALGGIALIGLDVLRERGKLGGKKPSPQTR